MPTEGLGNKKVNKPSDTLTIFYEYDKPAGPDLMAQIKKNYPGGAKAYDEAYDLMGKAKTGKEFNRIYDSIQAIEKPIADSLIDVMPGMFEAQANYSLNNPNLKKEFGHIQAFPIGVNPATGDTVTRQNVEDANIGPNTTVQILGHASGTQFGKESSKGFWKDALCDAESVALGTCFSPNYGQKFANSIEKDVMGQGYYDVWSGINPYAKDFKGSVAYTPRGSELEEGESVVKTYKPGDKPYKKKKPYAATALRSALEESAAELNSTFVRTITQMNDSVQ